MRILLVTEDVPAPMLGGAGQHAVVLGNALLDAGHEVHLLGYRTEEAAAGDNGFKGPLHRGIDFRGARWREDAAGAFMPMARPHMARRLWQAIQALPGTWDVVHYHGHNPLLGRLVPASWNFVHTLHDQGSECIVKTRFRNGAPCTERSAAACAGCATPEPNALQRWLSTQAVTGLRQGSLAAFRRHKTIFVSEFLRRRYGEVMGIHEAAVDGLVVHNFVSADRLKVAAERAEATPPDDRRLAVFSAGRIDRPKGYAQWLESISDGALARLDITIAGDGPDRPALQSLHGARGITFLGWCDPGQVLAQTANCDAYVVPSVWDEPCATTILEALALGRTVFALRRGGTPELTSYGAPGQLRLFETLPELAAALAQAQALEWPLNDRAAVTARLPQLLAIYTAPLNTSLPEALAA
jgi:glycosyltransferase involved in cell wall biosynthesis